MPFIKKKSTLAAFCLLTLASCNDGVTTDPLDSYRHQSVIWSTCEDIPEELNESIIKRLQCTELRAPMDYANPRAGEIKIALMRVKSLSSEREAEPLFFNPGGPGGDGYDMGANYFNDLVTAADFDPQSPSYRVLQNFDFIGFSPRGIGKSTQLSCQSENILEPVDNSEYGRTPENIAAQFRNTKTIAQACQSNPLAKHIHTAATAKDLDLMREILGAKKLNFYGVSYGTWLGLWYAGLYPNRVGKMVLDSNVDFTDTLQTAMLVQGPALSRTFNDVLAPYAARHPDIFSLGDDADAIRNMVAQLHPTVRAAAARKVYDNLFNSQGAPIFFDYLLVAKILSQPPFQNQWPQGLGTGNFAALKSLIAQEIFSANEEADSKLREYANSIVAEVEEKQKFRAVSDEEADPVYTAVVCNDSFTQNSNPQWWAQQETLMLTKYPIAGTQEIRSCLDWTPAANVVKPSMSAMQNLDILLLQAELDGATPVEGALASFANLPKAHMVLVRSSMDHGVSLDNACTKGHLLNYLLGSSPDQRISECQGAPLPEDANHEPHNNT